MDRRQPWEKAIDAGYARNRHPRHGHTCTMSNIGRARAETARALEEAGRRRRLVQRFRSSPGDIERFAARIWYPAWRDAAGWRCRAEDSQRRGMAYDLGASCGFRTPRAVGDALFARPLAQGGCRAALPTWVLDTRAFGPALWDRLQSRL